MLPDGDGNVLLFSLEGKVQLSGYLSEGGQANPAGLLPLVIVNLWR